MIFTFVHTTDLHGRRGLLGSLPAPSDSTILLDSGDAISGSCTVFRMREPVLSDMREAGFSAMAMGNREYSYFPAVAGMRVAEAGFPVLAANVLFAGKGVGVRPFVILERLGFRIAVIGLAPVQFLGVPFLSALCGSRFVPYRDALRTVEPEVSSADLRILLSHSGLREDVETAEEFGFIDLVLAGHSHMRFKEPIYVSGVPIIHSGAFGESYSEVKVEMPGGRLAGFRTVFPEGGK